MNYENYLRGLVKRANEVQSALEEWRGIEMTVEDAGIISEMLHFIGYCQALEGLLEKDNKDKE